MAKAPVFKDSRQEVVPSPWKPGHRPPAMGYGNLDGVAYGTDSYESVSKAEQQAEGDAPLIAIRQKVTGRN